MSRLVIAEVEGSRTKATVPAKLLENRERDKWEVFFRELLRLRPDQVLTIRESE